MSRYYIEPIVPGLVKVHEDVVSYPMTEAQAKENLAVVQANRKKYASDEAYLRRLNFYEDILDALEAASMHNGKGE